jgi:acetate kinase
MKVLTINSGSSSVKYQLIDTHSKTALCRGLVERIGIEGTCLKHYRHSGEKVTLSDKLPDHQTAIECVLNILISPEYGVIKSLDQIDAIGHRLVHAGEKFKHSVLIDREVLAKLHECIEYAPLHNPPNIKGVEAALGKLPGIPNVGVFDTTFHVNMPDYAFTYGVPQELYKKFGIRRYGFHGSSHYYVSHRAAEILGKNIRDLKIITCHLGNGSSMAAVNQGISVDTTMGFTPLEGLLMGTRCGDIDPGLIFIIASKENLDLDGINTFFNRKCGVLGISGLSSDMREVEEAAAKGHPQALLAENVFCYRIKKYVGAFIAAMNGVDAIVFTGGIGENSEVVRRKSLAELDYLGIRVDELQNKGLRGKEAVISLDNAAVKILVIPTNEELVIAEETERIVQGKTLHELSNTLHEFMQEPGKS